MNDSAGYGEDSTGCGEDSAMCDEDLAGCDRASTEARLVGRWRKLGWSGIGGSRSRRQSVEDSAVARRWKNRTTPVWVREGRVEDEEEK